MSLPELTTSRAAAAEQLNVTNTFSLLIGLSPADHGLATSSSFAHKEKMDEYISKRLNSALAVCVYVCLSICHRRAVQCAGQAGLAVVVLDGRRRSLTDD